MAQAASSNTITAISQRTDMGTSFQSSYNFSGTEVCKKQNLAVFCQQQRLCSGWVDALKKHHSSH